MNIPDSEIGSLSRAQRAALQYVAEQASNGHPRVELEQLLQGDGAELKLLDEIIFKIEEHARIAVHFHPDRIGMRGSTVAEALLEDGIYRSQFETGISNGGLSAFRGGDRDQWEADLFGGCYQAPYVQPEERPKYGALDLFRFSDGPAPRFGSCYLVLRTSVSRRCTFTFGDSNQPTEYVGVLGRMECITLGLLRAVASGEWPTANSTKSVSAFLRWLCRNLTAELPHPQQRPFGRLLDHYVEAQVHGPLQLSSDVERVVADPCFRGTPTGLLLEKACADSEVALQWHAGFCLPIQSVSNTFRGPAMPLLARRIAVDGKITAAVIGQASASLRRDPEAWADWGTPAETAQHLKQLWHILVHQGAPEILSEAL